MLLGISEKKHSSYIPLEKGGICCSCYKMFFKYFSRCDKPRLIERVTWLLFTPSALAMAALLIPQK